MGFANSITVAESLPKSVPIDACRTLYPSPHYLILFARMVTPPCSMITAATVPPSPNSKRNAMLMLEMYYVSDSGNSSNLGCSCPCAFEPPIIRRHRDLEAFVFVKPGIFLVDGGFDFGQDALRRQIVRPVIFARDRANQLLRQRDSVIRLPSHLAR